MSTKKLLVAFDPKRPMQQSSDFLVVALDGARPTLVGIKSNRPAESGLMIYLGREITANDLFAKLVDTGRKIESVNMSLRTLENYIHSLQNFRIGNIIGIETDEAGGFKLVKLSDSPPAADIGKVP